MSFTLKVRETIVHKESPEKEKTFDKLEDILMHLANYRSNWTEFENNVQDTETVFKEDNGTLIADTKTVDKGNYADQTIEWKVLDNDGNKVAMTWDMVDFYQKKEEEYEYE